MLGVLAVVVCGAAAWPPAGHAPPRLLLGPTANHKLVANETIAFLEASPGWAEVRGRLAASGGAVHIREVFRWYPDLQERLAAAMRGLGVGLSVEAGEGGFCGAGSGAAAAAADLAKLSAYFAAGGRVKFWEITSSFSRTHRACAAQSLAETVAEAAEYGAYVQARLPEAKLFLYDALPHYAVGDAYPASAAGYGLELTDVLAQLQRALAGRNVTLTGYWADCPADYSTAYPYGDGYAKIAAAAAAAASLGLEFGKTFNSQSGGAASDAAFYAGTVADFARTAAVLPSPTASLSYAMVETWYAHPAAAGPEGSPYTTAYTARAVFRRIRNSTAA
eukprot:TRINITY_DN6096_c4_g1_i1.p1 TRINITY_DN6096_c4_g1~~TRINITY_DN6096_c4_g1_i1.p1  ORF type:complete len:334 (+),score=92.61 TRINITY_DN6096_c4_g1_i1:48-1049(+)